jgi:OOP family OmpA-OmpF porin
LLDEIAQVMNMAPHVKLIEIGGHASSEGSDKHNLKLSDARTKSVMEYLVTKGNVPKEKLSAKGYGETKPLVSPEETEADRERNRRVEFLIVEQDVTKKKVEVDPTTGKENVVESATETKKAAPVVEAPKAEEKKAP